MNCDAVDVLGDLSRFHLPSITPSSQLLWEFAAHGSQVPSLLQTSSWLVGAILPRDAQKVTFTLEMMANDWGEGTEVLPLEITNPVVPFTFLNSHGIMQRLDFIYNTSLQSCFFSLVFSSFPYRLLLRALLVNHFHTCIGSHAHGHRHTWLNQTLIYSSREPNQNKHSLRVTRES